MMDALRKLVERQLLKSRAEGKLSGLEGEGKPLPDRSGDVFGDPALAAGFRIMAEAGVVPEEFDLARQLEAARAEWRAASGEAERREAMARIADLEMRYSLARDARRAFMK